jgi:hypothetical protein
MSNVMPSIEAKLTGLCPLLLNNDQMADPENAFAIRKEAITSNSKLKRTDKGREELKNISFFAGLHTYKGKVVIPANMIYANILKSSKTWSRGPDVKAGIVVSANPIHLKFPDDDKTIEELYVLGYHDTRLACIGRTKERIMRTRPRFDEWSCDIQVYYDDGIFKYDDLVRIMERAGRIGIGDYRDLFGKYVLDIKKAKGKGKNVKK